MKKFRLVFLSVIMLFAIIPSVYATWYYAGHAPQEVRSSFDTSMNQFGYTPEEVLPGHEVGSLGQNHQEVVYNITDHKTYGLNNQKKPVLTEYLNQNGIVYSNQKTSGGNLKFLGDESESIMWVVEKETDSEYMLYTFLKDHVDSDYLGQSITVYKTKCVKENGVWTNVRSFTGTAPIVRISGLLTIDVNQWKDAVQQ